MNIDFLEFISGLLPRKTGQVVHCACVIHIYDSVENYIPFH